MERQEIAQELKQLHDRMVYGGQIIPDGKLIQAVFEAAALIEAEEEIVVEV